MHHSRRPLPPVRRWRRTLPALLLAAAAGLAAAEPAHGDTDAAATRSVQMGWRLQLDSGGIGGALSRDGRRHAGHWLRRATWDIRWRPVPGWRAAWSWQAGSGGTSSVEAAWLQWQPSGGPVGVRLGRVAPDFGLDSTISSSWGHLPERSPLWDLAPDLDDTRRTVALRMDAAAPDWHASAGAYRRPDRQALVARIVWRHNGDALQPHAVPGWLPPGLHLGASWAWQRSDADTGRLRSRLGQRAASALDSGQRLTLLPAWPRDAKPGDDQAAGLEASLSAGRWWLAMEGLYRRQDAAAASLSWTRQASGWTATAARTLHGSPRGWDANQGRYRGPSGAAVSTVELVLRADHLRATASDAGSPLAHANLLSLGLNWFIDAQWRLSAVVSQGQVSGTGALSGWAMRLQWTH